MISLLICFFESIVALLCIHMVFAKQIKKTYKEIIYIFAYCLTCMVASHTAVQNGLVLVILIWSFLWSKNIFRESWLNTILKTIIGMIAVGVSEAITMFALNPVIKNIVNVHSKMLFMSFSCGVFVLILYCVSLNRKSGKDSIIINKNIAILTTIAFSFLLYIKLEYENSRKISMIYVFFFVILALTFVGIIIEERKNMELEKINIKNQLQEIYGQAYEELLQLVRRRQHDYNNQLTAVYSMHISATTLDELICMQKEYMSLLEKDKEYDSMLTNCNNPIISGYLYSVSSKLQEKGIKIDIKVRVVSSEIDTKTKDIVEILGILITNATEQVEYEKEKCIDVHIIEGKNIVIEVLNKAKYCSAEDIEKMFSMNYSTKGDNRGIGLPVLKEIVGKYNGEVVVENKDIDENNWISFTVSI